MGIDIHITVLGRKENDGYRGDEADDSLYKALMFYKKKPDGTYMGFDFPYFRNSFVFHQIQERFNTPNYRKFIPANVENYENMKWYDDSFEASKSPENYYLWGHGWCKMKDLGKWIEELHTQIKERRYVDGSDFEYTEESSAEDKEVVGLLTYIYQTVEKMLSFDEILEDRELEYDVANSVILFAFDN